MEKYELIFNSDMGKLVCYNDVMYNLLSEFFVQFSGGLCNHTSLTSISMATMTILIYFRISKLYIESILGIILIEDRSQSTQSLDTSFE